MEIRRIVDSVLDKGPILPVLILLLVSALWGYFLYAASLKAAMAVLILGILFALSLIIAWIPFCGAVIQISVMALFIQPWTFQFTGLYATWLTEVLFLVFAIGGIIITALMTMEVIASSKIKKEFFKKGKEVIRK